ncbi:MAG: right-handed parallel beta-helix repeat-containing protein, partial [Planctomycetota bacterium]|nr:right-handed parallel beta-helix repeat-containing protein [Planctomycetota bacterium]
IQRFGVALAFSLLSGNVATAGVLEVGPGRQFPRIEAANKAARPGDTILVYPRKKGAAYEKVAVFVTKPRLTFLAARKKKSPRVMLSGQGFDYSGKGSVPRGIFQFQKGSDGGTVKGFALTEAHNKSHNGAGVRINQANSITVTDCEIHHNDMGVQSNGDGTLKAGMHQLISHCKVHHNGNKKDPGYNHNFYLGGASAVIRFCEVFEPLTGHNIKSRAHFNLVEYNYIHDSLNREFDLVDGKETGLPGSHSILRGNIIVKAKPAKGNKGVIHFGQDGGKDHNGTLYLVHNTILSPYLSPVVELSAKNAKAEFYNNIIDSAGTKQRKQVLLSVRKGASFKDCKVAFNWLGAAFKGAKAEYGMAGNGFYKASPAYRNPGKGDYQLAKAFKGLVNAGLPLKKIKLPTLPGAKKEKSPIEFSYKAELDKAKRKIKGRPDIGAYEYGK